jgi:hypothetical protein
MTEQVRLSSAPSEAASIERARSLANEAMHMVSLQRRRIRSQEPEDETFAFRWWTDFQFLVISLWRLRSAAVLAIRSHSAPSPLKTALGAFDQALPDLRRMRNVGEHADEYALDRGRDRAVDRRHLQAGAFDGTTFLWLRGRLNLDQALVAAENLYRAIRAGAEPSGNESEQAG